MPAAKSPHGVDVSPDGKYVVASGKLQSITTVFNIEKVLTAIQNKDFTGDEDGIPVLNYDNIVDKIPVSYNIGHLTAAEGDTKSPDGKYLVALNKLSHGRHLSVGPSQPEASQLIDITGEKMALLYDAFTEPEPHYAQIIKADKLTPIEVYPKEEN